MLVKVADVYEGEVDNVVTGLTSILEPIMIVLLAVIVGTIVIALFMPMIGLITGMSDQANKLNCCSSCPDSRRVRAGLYIPK